MAKLDLTGMTLEERMELARKTAQNYFREGLNCGECVMRTFLDMHDTGLPEEVICLVTGFGGGIGHTKNNCGAITGAVCSVGMVKGRRDPFELDDMAARVEQLQKKIYPLFGSLATEIKGQYGSTLCGEISAPFGDFDSRERKLNCKKLIGDCAAIAEKYAFGE